MTSDDERQPGVAQASRRSAVDEWLKLAEADADRRQLPELKTVLRQFARATSALRAADRTLYA